GLDEAESRYKLHLRREFVCGFVCFELRETEAHSEATLKAAMSGVGLRGFFGGLILRAEGHTTPHTGRVSLTRSETPMVNSLRVEITPLGEIGLLDSVEAAPGVHIGVSLDWSEANFAKFAFDLIAIIQGTYDPMYLSSFYGMGSSFQEMVDDIGA